MEKETLYELNPSQEVVKLQCKYTLFKRVINILSSATTNKDVDLSLMKKAFNKVVERNDCLRLNFIKKDGKLMQYFEEKKVFDEIPYIEFKNKEEQDNFFLELRKKPIKYMKGIVVEPYFIKTFDKKFMVALKVCHLILDIYGINIIFKDLFEVYEALKNNTELPQAPSKFENVLINDLKNKNNEDAKQKNTEFFTNYLKSKENPYYAGIHGLNEPIFQKELAKGRHTSKMFFVKNDTHGFMHEIDKDIVEKAITYSKENNYSLSSFFFYALSICASKINGGVKNMLPLELCNCRGTILEKRCAGTKAQSVARYTVVDKDKTFEENLSDFCKDQKELYRHLGFSDQEFQMLLHKIYNEPIMNTFYSISFSFIPIQKPKDIDIQIYSNGKCALPAYLGVMWDVDTNQMNMIYDCYIKTHSEEDIAKFHKKYLNILRQVLENPKIKIVDIKE